MKFAHAYMSCMRNRQMCKPQAVQWDHVLRSLENLCHSFPVAAKSSNLRHQRQSDVGMTDSWDGQTAAWRAACVEPDPGRATDAHDGNSSRHALFGSFCSATGMHWQWTHMPQCDRSACREQGGPRPRDMQGGEPVVARLPVPFAPAARAGGSSRLRRLGSQWPCQQ
jgi:hypothetical protein